MPKRPFSWSAETLKTAFFDVITLSSSSLTLSLIKNFYYNTIYIEYAKNTIFGKIQKGAPDPLKKGVFSAFRGVTGPPLLYPPKSRFLAIFYSAPYIKTTCRFSKIAKSKTAIFGPPDRPFLTIFRHRHDASINIVYIYLLLLCYTQPYVLQRIKSFYATVT